MMSPRESYALPATIARRIVHLPATREVVPHLPGESFRWMEHDYPSPIARWNYHPEFEIHLIRKGTGSYLIGDQIGTFGPGHVAMLGPQLPHDWMSDLAPNEMIEGRDAVIQFDLEWISRCAEVIPELRDFKPILDASTSGIVFAGDTAIAAAAQIEAVGTSRGTSRISNMFALLAILASAPPGDTTHISPNWLALSAGREGGTTAVDAGLAYILENFTSRIRMSEAARLAHMSEPSFSKYFKKASGLTFSDMVKRLRIANACRLLEQTDNAISTISAAVGYTNLANFNRQFLTEMGVTPRVYRTLEDDERPQAKALGLGRRTG